jgi:hypothetical protein
LLLTTLTIRWSVKKKIDSKTTIIFLCFTVIASFIISNYDVILHIKWGNIEVQTAVEKISQAKQTAIDEIRTEVKDQKESVRLLIASANDTRDKVEAQKKSLSELINTATLLQKKIDEQKIVVSALNEDTKRTKVEIKKLNEASAQIALILVRATYFTLETKNEFGGPRSRKAVEEIQKDLNYILPIVIPDMRERDRWIKNLQNTLPPPPKK